MLHRTAIPYELNRDRVTRQSSTIIQMPRATDHKNAPHASATRRVLKTLLVVAYLVVGFGGEISCAKESLSTEASLDLSAASAGAEEGSKKAPTVVEHCYTCVPLTIPAAIQIFEPVGVSVGLSFRSNSIIVVERRFLDPPPPKTST